MSGVRKTEFILAKPVTITPEEGRQIEAHAYALYRAARRIGDGAPRLPKSELEGPGDYAQVVFNVTNLGKIVKAILTRNHDSLQRIAVL